MKKNVKNYISHDAFLSYATQPATSFPWQPKSLHSRPILEFAVCLILIWAYAEPPTLGRPGHNAQVSPQPYLRPAHVPLNSLPSFPP